MNQKTYIQVTGLLLTVGVVVHLLRLILGWSANIADWEVPVWLSVVAVVVAGYLAWSAYKLMK